MKCKNCSAEVSSNAKYCSACGAEVSNLSINSLKTISSKPSLSKECGSLIIPAILVVIVIAVSLAMAKGNNSNKEINHFISTIVEGDSEENFYCIFSERIVEKSIDDYYDDYCQSDSFLLSTYYSLAKDDYIDSIFQQGLSIQKKALSAYQENLPQIYGDDYKISYKITSQKSMNKKEITELVNHYKSAYPTFSYSLEEKKITKGKKLNIKFQCKGKKYSFEDECTVNMYYISGDGWIIDDRIYDDMMVPILKK